MLKMTTIIASLAAASGLALAVEPNVAAPLPLPADAASKTSLTIYSSAQPGAINPDLYRPVPGQPQYGYNQRPPVPGYAVIRSDRTIELAANRQTIKFDDVAAYLDPTTVSFTSLTDPAGTSVLEQNYQFDLVSGEKLLQRFLDKNITVSATRGTQSTQFTGTLLSSGNGQLILREDKTGEIRLVNGVTDIALPKLPDGLITKPTLIWDVSAAKAGPHNVRVAYQTEGITWWADYNLVYTEGENANKGLLDINAWVSILNQSGATYPHATLKLIAGDVHRAPRPQNYAVRTMEAMSDARGGAPDAGFQEKSFFEYHLYTLGRPATIPDNSTKQIELFPGAHNVPCDKIIVYDGAGANIWFDPYNPMLDQGYGVQSNKDVNVYLRFKNDKASGMGMPLPAGRLRVSKVDSADGSLEFIGEDVNRHTPKDEEVLVKLGNAFDVVGERIQADFKIDTNRKTIDETIEIRLRNRKDAPLTVIAQEHMYRWTGWEITKSTIDPKKLDARLVHFPVTLKAGEEAIVRYTVRYKW